MLTYNEDWEFCVAGAAIISVGSEPEQWSLVTRQLLFGPYCNSYRAEVFAVLLALQKIYYVDIKSDCKAVVHEMKRALQCYSEGTIFVPTKHSDLWMIIWKHITSRERGSVCIGWVKAHADDTSMLDAEQKKVAFFNNIVDLETKKAVCADHFDLRNALGQVVQTKQHMLQQMENIMILHWTCLMNFRLQWH